MNKLQKGQWSRKYSKCLNCGTTKIKHHSFGLCKKCNNKNYRTYHREYYHKKRKGNPEYVKNHKASNKKNYHKNKEDIWFLNGNRKKNRERIKKERYLKFISKNKYYLKKYQGGIKYICDGCDKDCLITSPCQISKRNGAKVNIIDLSLFKKLVIEECGKKPIETSP